MLQVDVLPIDPGEDRFDRFLRNNNCLHHVLWVRIGDPVQPTKTLVVWYRLGLVYLY